MVYAGCIALADVVAYTRIDSVFSESLPILLPLAHFPTYSYMVTTQLWFEPEKA